MGYDFNIGGLDPMMQAQMMEMLKAMQGNNGSSSAPATTTSTPSKAETPKVIKLTREEREEIIKELKHDVQVAKKEDATAAASLKEATAEKDKLDGKNYTSSDMKRSLWQGVKNLATDMVMSTDDKGKKHFSR